MTASPSGESAEAAESAGVRVALTVAGSDPSGGAGIQADLRTFDRFGVYGMSVVTVLTVQNTCGVTAVHPVDPTWAAAQLEAVASDIAPHAIKTGALGTKAIVESVAPGLRDLVESGIPLVVDPVARSTHGAELIAPEALRAVVERLLPLATLVTPNAAEAEALTGIAVTDAASALAAGRRIVELGARAVLVKGGHFGDRAVDHLVGARGGRAGEIAIDGPRFDTESTHGTGCTLAAAIAARLAEGADLEEAVRGAKAYLSDAIEHAPGLGGGQGPVGRFGSDVRRVDGS